MAVIFYFSAQPGEASSQSSLGVGRLIGRVFVEGYEDWPKERQDLFAEKIDHPIRKSAHAAEYAVLAILLFLALRRRFWAAFALAAAYAASDEFHQRFVPARSGQISDVLLDSAGALAGLLLLAGVTFLVRGRAEKRRAENGADA